MAVQTLEQFIASWPTLPDTEVKFAECVSAPMSPEEEVRDDGSRAVRTFFCKWSDRIAFMRALLGYPELVSNGGSQFIHRNLPKHHPDYKHRTTGKPYMYCTEVIRCEPWSLPDGDANPAIAFNSRSLRSSLHVAQYGLARIQAAYETLPYDVLADSELPLSTETGNPEESAMTRFVLVTSHPSGETLSVPMATAWYVDQQALQGFPRKSQPSDDVNVTWYQVPTAAIGIKFINPNAPKFPINDAMGKVNKNTFLGCPPGTLLLVAACPRPVRGAFGDRLWTIDFKFKHFNPPADGLELPLASTIGHNHLLRCVKATDNNIRYVEVVMDNLATDVATNLTNKAAGKNIYDWYPMEWCFQVPRAGMTYP